MALPAFLSSRPRRTASPMVARHRDGVRVAEEVGRVQQVDVQRVALDPLAAVEEAPQRAELSVDDHAERVLDRVHGAHLVGDRTDAADPRGDVGRFAEGAAAQERLEEARRLEDRQARPTRPGRRAA